MGVLPEESANGYIEADKVVPARHQLYGHKGSSFSCGHEGVDVEDEGEFVEVGHELVELQVSCSVF